jgi:hypothetical protein
MLKVAIFQDKPGVLTRVASLLILISWSAVSTADHLPENQISRSKPEQSIGNVVLERTTIKELINKYGKPNSVEVEADENDKERGEKSYIWQLSTCRLNVGTWFQPGRETPVTSVEVSGTSPSKECSTSRGLSLGASIGEIDKTYGPQYQHGRKTTNHRLYVLIEWKNETQADVDFNADDKIDRIQLRSSVE